MYPNNETKRVMARIIDPNHVDGPMTIGFTDHIEPGVRYAIDQLLQNLTDSHGFDVWVRTYDDKEYRVHLSSDIFTEVVDWSALVQHEQTATRVGGLHEEQEAARQDLQKLVREQATP